VEYGEGKGSGEEAMLPPQKFFLGIFGVRLTCFGAFLALF